MEREREREARNAERERERERAEVTRNDLSASQALCESLSREISALRVSLSHEKEESALSLSLERDRVSLLEERCAKSEAAALSLKNELSLAKRERERELERIARSPEKDERLKYQYIIRKNLSFSLIFIYLSIPI
jgi:hypothetical protein